MNKEYLEYLESSEWQVVRRIALDFAAYKCVICNCEDKLDTHHRNYDNFGRETLHDVVVLCRGCHEIFHKHKDFEKKESLDYLMQDISETSAKIKEIKRLSKLKYTKTSISKNDNSKLNHIHDDDLKADIEAVLELGKEYHSFKGVNRYAIKKLMESLNINLKFHSRICNAIDREMDKDLDSAIDYIFAQITISKSL